MKPSAEGFIREMKRVHVLEFEDCSWFPGWLRTSLTNIIVVFSRKMGVVDVLSHLLDGVLQRHGHAQIVDLGSGGGGPMPEVTEALRSAGHPELTLRMTDKFPNADASARFDGRDAHIRYEATSVDATQLQQAPPGVRTMINCFHHMRPEQAKQILTSAEESGQPLLVYELADNKIPFALWLLTLPLGLVITFLMALVFGAMVRPMSWRQLVFTYLIPVVPLFYAWDGQASLPRIYGLSDLDTLLEGRGGPGYRWTKGPARDARGRAVGIYLLGEPVG